MTTMDIMYDEPILGIDRVQFSFEGNLGGLVVSNNILAMAMPDTGHVMRIDLQQARSVDGTRVK